MEQNLGGNSSMVNQPFDGCKVALFIGDRLLTILRDDDPVIPWPNMWDLPGGGREGSETPFETLVREVQEEVGLILPEHAVEWQKRYPGIAIPNTFVWFFVARLPIGTESQIQFGNEGQEWRLQTIPEFTSQPNVIPSYEARLNDWQKARS